VTVLVVGSVRGAPGVTSTALLLGGCLDDSAVAEADPDGGVLAIRYRLGREPGLTTLAASHVSDPEGWREHAQDAGGVPILVGPDAPDRMAMLWSRAGRDLVAAMEASTAIVVVVAGRLRPGEATSAMLASASLALVLARPVPEDLVGLAHRLPGLRRAADVALLVVGTGTYSIDDISAEFGVDVLGVLPDDRRSASMLSARGGSARGLARTSLARAVRTVADRVAARTAAVAAADSAAGPTSELREEAVT
jgi:hypothetical protein